MTATKVWHLRIMGWHKAYWEDEMKDFEPGYSFETECKTCGDKILMMMQESGNWVPLENCIVDFEEVESEITLVTSEGRRVKVFPDDGQDGYGYPIHFEFCDGRKKKWFTP